MKTKDELKKELEEIEEGAVELLRNWKAKFSVRQQEEIKLARFYACNFANGTVGHNSLLIIAKMSSLLNLAEESLVFERIVGSGETLQSEEVGAAIANAKKLAEQEQVIRRVAAGKRFA